MSEINPNNQNTEFDPETQNSRQDHPDQSDTNGQQYYDPRNNDPNYNSGQNYGGQQYYNGGQNAGYDNQQYYGPDNGSNNGQYYGPNNGQYYNQNNSCNNGQYYNQNSSYNNGQYYGQNNGCSNGQYYNQNNNYNSGQYYNQNNNYSNGQYYNQNNGQYYNQNNGQYYGQNNGYNNGQYYGQNSNYNNGQYYGGQQYANPQTAYSPAEPAGEPVTNTFCYILMALTAISAIIGIIAAKGIITNMFASVDFNAIAGDDFASTYSSMMNSFANAPGYSAYSVLNSLLGFAIIVISIIDIVHVHKKGYPILGMILFTIFCKPGYFIWRAYVLKQKKTVPVLYTVAYVLLYIIYFFWSFYFMLSLIS